MRSFKVAYEGMEEGEYIGYVRVKEELPLPNRGDSIQPYYYKSDLIQELGITEHIVLRRHYTRDGDLIFLV